MRFAPLLLAALVTLACRGPFDPDTPGAMTGVIAARDVPISIGVPPTVHVRVASDDECGVIFLVRPSTTVLRSTSGGGTVRASVSELTVGRHVSVWSQVVLDSCPGQSSADVILIRD